MRRYGVFVSFSATPLAAVGSARRTVLTVPVASTVSDAAPSPALAHALSVAPLSSVSMTSHAARGVGLFRTTPIARFDIKQHEMEKRRRRELERAGIDPDDEDELPWVAPEEQQRLDEDAELRKAEEEERRRAFLEKREKDDAVKRQKFKEFRAKQISLSQDRKKATAAKKEEHRLHREAAQSRTDGAEEDTTEETATAPSEDAASPSATPTDDASNATGTKA